MTDDERVTFRELSTHIEGVKDQIDEVEKSLGDRVSRVEKALIAVGVVVAMPKVGGPTPSEIVGAILNYL